MTPSVSRFSTVIETGYFEVLISFHLECSRLTFLSTYYGNVEPVPGGCRCTHELNLLLVLGLVQCKWFGTFEYHHLVLGIVHIIRGKLFKWLFIFHFGRSWFKTSGIVQPYTKPAYLILAEGL